MWVCGHRSELFHAPVQNALLDFSWVGPISQIHHVALQYKHSPPVLSRLFACLVASSTVFECRAHLFFSAFSSVAFSLSSRRQLVLSISH